MLHVAPLGFLSFSTGGYVPAGAIWLDGSADYLVWTPSTGSTNTAITYSFWAKRSGLTSYGAVLSGQTSGTPGQSDFIRYSNNDAMETIGDDGNDWSVKTNALYRDTTAWEHWVISFNNTTDVRMWKNGVEITSFATNVESGTMGGWLRATQQIIGKNQANQYYNGYLAEVIALDGTAVTDALDFGEFDTNGNWVPVDPSGLTFGTNGYWLNFADSADLGNDVSGNGNDFTPTSMSSANSTSDRPADKATNDLGNYGHASPINKLGNTATMTTTPVQGGRLIGGDGAVVSSIATTSGKWYCEFYIVGSGSNYPIPGVTRANIDENGWYLPGVNIRSGDGYISQYPFMTPSIAYGSSYTAGDIIMMALDQENGAVWFGKNGTWFNSATTGEIEAGTTTNAAADSGDWSQLNDGTPMVVGLATYSTGGGTGRMIVEPSAFTYTPPTGFKSLNTANLSAPQISTMEKGFVCEKDTGANIVATLNAAKSGTWTDYIHAFKNRTTGSTNWIWNFSDDTGNMIHTNSTAAKTTYSAPSGSDNFVGYGWRVGATWGCYTAEISHTNGADTDTAHGLTSPTGQYAGFCKLTNTTGDFYFTHPKLTSGYNFTIVSSTAESTTQYIAIDGTNVTIKSAAPTGTYRVVVWAEIPGFCEFPSWTGNASADGPVCMTKQTSPVAFISKPRTNTGGPWIWDSVRGGVDDGTGGNPVAELLDWRQSVNESGMGTSDIIDFNSNGIKVRAALSGLHNANGVEEVAFVWGRPFGGEGVAQAKAR